MTNNKYKKYYLIEVILVVAIFIGVYPILKVKNANMDNIRATINEKVSIENMNVGTEKDLKKLYDINKNDIDDFIYYSPKTNMDEDELLVLKVKEEEKTKDIKKQIQSRMDKKSDSFKSYRPEKYEVIKDAVIKAEGRYLIFIVSEEASNILSAIEKDFK